MSQNRCDLIGYSSPLRQDKPILWIIKCLYSQQPEEKVSPYTVVNSDILYFMRKEYEFTMSATRVSLVKVDGQVVKKKIKKNSCETNRK